MRYPSSGGVKEREGRVAFGIREHEAGAAYATRKRGSAPLALDAAGSIARTAAERAQNCSRWFHSGKTSCIPVRQRKGSCSSWRAVQQRAAKGCVAARWSIAQDSDRTSQPGKAIVRQDVRTRRVAVHQCISRIAQLHLRRRVPRPVRAGQDRGWAAPSTPARSCSGCPPRLRVAPPSTGVPCGHRTRRCTVRRGGGGGGRLVRQSSVGCARCSPCSCPCAPCRSLRPPGAPHTPSRRSASGPWPRAAMARSGPRSSMTSSRRPARPTHPSSGSRPMGRCGFILWPATSHRWD